MAELSLVFDLLARDRASAEVKKVGDSMDDAGRSASGFGSMVGKAMLAAGAAALAAGAGLYKVGETFDTMSDTIRVGTGATGEALDELIGSAKNIGREVPANFEDIGSTVADVNTRLGLTGPTLEKLSSQVLQAGRILNEEVDIGGLSASFSAFNVTSEDTTAVMDDLYRISQATGVGINELAAGVTKGAPQLQQFGFSIGESAALLGSLDKAGLNSDATIAALNRGMVEFAKAGKEPRAALEETIEGIEGFIAKGDQAAAIDLAASLFGTKGAGQFVQAVRSGTMSLDDLMGATGATSDTILGAAEDTADFAEQWQLFKNNALLKIEPIATRVFNAIGDGMAWFSSTGGPALEAFAGVVIDEVKPAFDLIRQAVTAFALAWSYNDGEVTSSGFNGYMERLGYVARQVADFLVGTLIPALGSFARWVNDNKKPLLAVAGVIAAVFLPHLIALRVQAGITAVKTAAAWAMTQARAVAAAAVHSAQVARMVAGWALLAVRSAASAARVAAAWTLMGARALAQAARMAAAWFIALGPIGWVTAAVIGVVGLIIANWSKVRAFTVRAWNAVTDKVSGAWQSVKTAVSNGISSVVAFVSGLPGRVIGAVGNLGSALYGKGRDMIQGLIDGAKSLLRNIGRLFLNVVPGWIRGPFEQALGISSPSKVFADYGRNIGQGLTAGIRGMRPAVADELAHLADTQAVPLLADLGARRGGGLGYRAPGYDMPAASAAGRGGATYVTTVSGVASPEQVAAVVGRAQRTTEFLAGAGS